MSSHYRTENAEIMAGRVLPKSQGDGSRFETYLGRHEAEVTEASERLLIRLLRYGADNRGLPNMTAGMCRAKLNEIGT